METRDLAQIAPGTLKLALVASCAATIFISLSGCKLNMDPNNPQTTRNPHPTQRYEITLTIDQPPGPFESVKGFADYQAPSECRPVLAFSGARPQLYEGAEFDLKPAGLNTYKGVVYADLLKDEDYYGLGVCHWKLVAVGANLKAGEVTFLPALFARQFSVGSVEYFPKADYGDNHIANRNVTPLPDDYVPTRKVELFFSTAMTAERK